MRPSINSRRGILGIFAVLLSLLSISTLHSPARAQDTLHARCTFDQFPLGPLRGARPDTMQPMLGANCTWNFGGDTISEFPQIGFSGGRIRVRDPFYYDTTVSLYRYDIGKLMMDACLAHQVTVFMPGTGGSVAEYTDAWQGRVGSPWNGLGGDTTQWIISQDSAISGTNYVLDSLTSGAAYGPFYGEGHVEQYLDSNHIGTASYEFVCHIDTGRFSPSHTTPLYTIEYWGRTQGDPTWRLLDTTQITYNSYIASDTALPPHTGHNCLADSLGLWTKRGEHVPNVYHVFKNIINVRPLYNGQYAYGWGAPASNPLMVDVRLRTYHQWPIFVRCLRIRDWRAQRLLSGAADGLINIIIDSLLNSKPAADSLANANYKGWVLFDEPNPPQFHAIAYMNELLVKRHAPPLSALIDANHELFYRIFRSQTNTNPAGFF